MGSLDILSVEAAVVLAAQQWPFQTCTFFKSGSGFRVTLALQWPYNTCHNLPHALQAIEERCNDIIREAHAVRHIKLDDSNRDALANSPLLRGVLPAPGHKLKGPVRLIEIEGVDINACGGTHLRSTAELQVGPTTSALCRVCNLLFCLCGLLVWL